jgi:prepilin-type N-terminal cleavage/methylation domain-containing protein
MLTNRLSHRAAHCSSRGGFTLVELLVVIGIIAILAGVALGPITNGIKQAKHNTSMQNARQIGQVCFSYATDNTINSNSYPTGANSESVAKLLITGNYVNDPSLFLVSDQIGRNAVTGVGTVTVAAGVTTVTMTAANISWNFVVTNVTPPTGGITANSSDLLPLIYFSGATPLTYPANTSGKKDLVLQAACPYGTDGVAVFYKGNNAAYLKAGTVTSGTVTNFVGPAYADANAYIELVP